MKVYRCDTCGEVFSRENIFVELIQVKSLNGKVMYRSLSGKHICASCSDIKYGPPVRRKKKVQV